MLKKAAGKTERFDDRPKRLMPNFPTRQGQHFNLSLGQNDGPYKNQG
jgi:hypothetical protein